MDFMVVAQSMSVLTALDRGIGPDPEFKWRSLKKAKKDMEVVFKNHAVDQPRFLYYRGLFYLQMGIRVKSNKKMVYFRKARENFEKALCDKRIISEVANSLARVILLTEEFPDEAYLVNLYETAFNHDPNQLKPENSLLNRINTITQEISTTFEMRMITKLTKEAALIYRGFPKGFELADLAMFSLYIATLKSCHNKKMGLGMRSSLTKEGGDLEGTADTKVEENLTQHFDNVVKSFVKEASNVATVLSDSTLSHWVCNFLKIIDQTKHLVGLLLVCLENHRLAVIVEHEIGKLGFLQIIDYNYKFSDVFTQFRNLCTDTTVIDALTAPKISRVPILFSSAASLYHETGPIPCWLTISFLGEKYCVSISSNSFPDCTVEIKNVVPEKGEGTFKLMNVSIQGIVTNLQVEIEQSSQFRFNLAMVTGKPIDEFFCISCSACNATVARKELFRKHNLCDDCWGKRCWSCLCVPDNKPMTKSGSCGDCFESLGCSVCKMKLTPAEKSWGSSLCNSCYDKWRCMRCNNLLTKAEVSYFTSFCNVCWDYYGGAELAAGPSDRKKKREE